MTIQFLRYIVKTAEIGSITEAAKQINISQPSLSAAIKEIEHKIGFAIFTRNRNGIALTKEGVEFLGYARQVIHEMDLLEARFINDTPKKQRFCVSTQHYTFTANAFVYMVQKFAQDSFEFILNETQTHQVLEDVKNRFCDLGIIYLCDKNRASLNKIMNDKGLYFTELFETVPHVFLSAKHPFAKKKYVTLVDLKPYPRLNFLQGGFESAVYSEEPFSTELSDKIIRVSDRASVVNLMIGLDGYTISSGILPKYLQGTSIVSIPLQEKETLHIGYVLCKNQTLSELAKAYIEELKKFKPDLHS